jgi:hypothetical protein
MSQSAWTVNQITAFKRTCPTAGVDEGLLSTPSYFLRCFETKL